MVLKQNTTIFTIGYGNRTVEEVVVDLEKYGIKVLCDVRSIPYSKYNQAWCQERLRPKLGQLGIRYIYLGKSLRGRPKSQLVYRNGELDYGLVQQSKFFQVGIQKLLQVNELHSTCMLCSEKNPKTCHRMKLIGTYLLDQSVQIMHILSNGTTLPQPCVPKPKHYLLDEFFEE